MVIAIIKLLEVMAVEIIEVKLAEIMGKLVLVPMLEVLISADSKLDVLEVDTTRI